MALSSETYLVFELAEMSGLEDSDFGTNSRLRVALSPITKFAIQIIPRAVSARLLPGTFHLAPSAGVAADLPVSRYVHVKKKELWDRS